MTKAERIYKDTRRDCKKHISDWGYTENSGFNSVTYSENETICARTINRLKMLVERAKKDLSVDVRLGILTEAQAEKEMQIIKMVEQTITNTIR